MAHKGFLRVAMDKKTKKGALFVSVLIGKTEDDKDGEWYSIFDSYWFGINSPYDIRTYASKDNPTPVVFEYTTSGDFKNVTAIRPATETWQPKKAVTDEADKDTGEEDEAKQSAQEPMTGRQMIAQAVELLVDGVGLVVREEKK